MHDLWYKDAIIYCLDVDSFQDANGDGIGDFLSWRRGDAILLAEANVAMEKIPDYFGDATSCICYLTLWPISISF